jgi:hypothetical protein
MGRVLINLIYYFWTEKGPALGPSVWHISIPIDSISFRYI